MSKVTIKFWNIEKQQYDEYWDYYLNEYMSVYRVESSEYYGDYLELMESIEPHFYKDGERIA